MPSRKSAGRRNPNASAYLRQRAGSAAAGARYAEDLSATLFPFIASGALVGLDRGALKRARCPVDVLGISEEVLEDLPLALAGSTAEADRLLVGHVEAECLRLCHVLRGLP